MKGYATKQWNTARSKDTPRTNNFRPDDHIDAIIDGFKGEWAVADLLEVPRTPDLSGTADDGSDVAIGDYTINVRYTPYPNGRLMCPANKPFHDCDWVVLVVGTDSPETVNVLGGVTVGEFYETCQHHDFGYGDTDYITQEQLRPWAEIASLIASEPQVEVRTRSTRRPRTGATSPHVGDDSMPHTCPRCGWPCNHLVKPYWVSPYRRLGGICAQCCIEANEHYDQVGWPPEPQPQLDSEAPRLFEE